MASSSQFDQELCRFLDPPTAGRLVLVSDDPLFQRTLRTTLFKTLAVKTDCLDFHQDTTQAMRSLRELLNRKVPVLVLADRLLRGQSNVEFLRNVKSIFPEARLLVMTQETTQEVLSLLYEIGVDSLLTKPVSQSTLVEKMAGAIRPQGKISHLVQEARHLLELGETAKVVQISEAILKIKGKSSVALMLLGDAYLQEGRRDDALRAYESAHEGARLYLEPLKKLASVHKQDDEDAYLRCLRKLDAISPLNTERKCEIGKVYVRRNDMERADKYFSAAILNARREAIDMVDRVISEIAESVAETAPALSEKYYVQLLELKGDDLTQADMVIFNRLGIALRRQGKWREAVENYKKALTVVPSDERVLYNMGLAYSDGQLYRMAVDAFAKVLRSNPDFYKKSVAAAYNMANAFALVKDVDMAQHLLEAVFKIDPEHAASHRLLARLEAQRIEGQRFDL